MGEVLCHDLSHHPDENGLVLGRKANLELSLLQHFDSAGTLKSGDQMGSNAQNVIGRHIPEPSKNKGAPRNDGIVINRPGFFLWMHR